jgi:hypothetical protein
VSGICSEFDILACQNCPATVPRVIARHRGWIVESYRTIGGETRLRVSCFACRGLIKPPECFDEVTG